MREAVVPARQRLPLLQAADGVEFRAWRLDDSRQPKDWPFDFAPESSHHRDRRRRPRGFDSPGPAVDRAGRSALGVGPGRLFRGRRLHKRLEVGADLDRVVERIEQNPEKRIVILASGDPLFYGTARYLCARSGKDRFEVVPHVEQHADGVRPGQGELGRGVSDEPRDARGGPRGGEGSHCGNSRPVHHGGRPALPGGPALIDRQIDYFTAYVCENLGSPDERVTHGELAEMAEQQFSQLNVMILVRKPHVPDRPASMKGRRLFGNPDEVFLQSQPKRGLLTPAEVRSIALSEMDLGPTSMVWDVGAGSGSVAIESAQIASAGKVYAIEMDPEDHDLISANAQRFDVKNLVPILGRAPECRADLPDPDAIFVGGAGRTVDRIVAAAYQRLRPGGRLVANVATIENVASVRQSLQDLAGDARVWMINIAREVYQLERMRFESQNPSFLIGVVKQA